jgi:hypothetical protein
VTDSFREYLDGIKILGGAAKEAEEATAIEQTKQVEVPKADNADKFKASGFKSSFKPIGSVAEVSNGHPAGSKREEGGGEDMVIDENENGEDDKEDGGEEDDNEDEDTENGDEDEDEGEQDIEGEEDDVDGEPIDDLDGEAMDDLDGEAM